MPPSGVMVGSRRWRPWLALRPMGGRADCGGSSGWWLPRPCCGELTLGAVRWVVWAAFTVTGRQQAPLSPPMQARPRGRPPAPSSGSSELPSAVVEVRGLESVTHHDTRTRATGPTARRSVAWSPPRSRTPRRRQRSWVDATAGLPERRPCPRTGTMLASDDPDARISGPSGSERAPCESVQTVRDLRRAFGRSCSTVPTPLMRRSLQRPLCCPSAPVVGANSAARLGPR